MSKVIWDWETLAIILACIFLWAIGTYAHGATDALSVLNAQRAQRGLYPYIHDEGLYQGAARCADVRASMLRFGHTNSDFSYLPPGVSAPMAGCAAWPVSMGFGACEEYGSRYRYAGAAWTKGSDGKNYCHAFYSNTPSSYFRPVANTARAVAGVLGRITGLPPSPYGTSNRTENRTVPFESKPAETPRVAEQPSAQHEPSPSGRRHLFRRSRHTSPGN